MDASKNVKRVPKTKVRNFPFSGYLKDAEAAKAEIQKKVDELEAMTEITVEIDSRIHPRIIGGRGRNVKQIMTDFKVKWAKRPADYDRPTDRPTVKWGKVRNFGSRKAENRNCPSSLRSACWAPILS